MSGARRGRAGMVVAALLAMTPASGLAWQGQGPTVVEPESLSKRADLVGKDVELDDRAMFQFHPNAGFDQVFLKRAPEVPCEIPPALRPKQPQAAAVKVRGVLKRGREDGRLFVDVSALELLPNDLERFNRAVAKLPRTDTETRMGWVHWAERRVRAFRPKGPRSEPDPVDVTLAARAKEVEADVIRLEGEKPARDPAGHWLALAERARARGVAEPEPSAQAHRAFRAAFAGAKTPADLTALRAKVEAFLPAAKQAPAAPDLSRWDPAYRNAPAHAYRQAPPDARAALDHRLWADVVQQEIERKGAANPGSLIALSGEAGRLLPDRPLVASALLEAGLAKATANVGALRLSEVEALAKLQSETLRQPEKARALYRAWLDDQRSKRLSPRDADGRLTLADQYEALVNDRETAVALLREAWAIDPGSKEIADAFRKRDFRKRDGEWVESDRANVKTNADNPATAASPAASPDEGDARSRREPDRVPPRDRGGQLRGATPDEVRVALAGRPNRRCYVGSQGGLTEQWIYYQPRKTLYINFRHKPGDPTPRVVAYYSLPRSPSDPPSGP